jgi:hypothetical protein
MVDSDSSGLLLPLMIDYPVMEKAPRLQQQRQ